MGAKGIDLGSNGSACSADEIESVWHTMGPLACPAQDRAELMRDVAVFARAANELCIVRGVRDPGTLRFPPQVKFDQCLTSA